jgi:hypothetical protein
VSWLVFIAIAVLNGVALLLVVVGASTVAVNVLTLCGIGVVCATALSIVSAIIADHRAPHSPVTNSGPV